MKRFRWLQPLATGYSPFCTDLDLSELGGIRQERGAGGNHDCAATWRRITDAVVQLANRTPLGAMH
jgi:hypothetical protein